MYFSFTRCDHKAVSEDRGSIKICFKLTWSFIRKGKRLAMRAGCPVTTNFYSKTAGAPKQSNRWGARVGAHFSVFQHSSGWGCQHECLTLTSWSAWGRTFRKPSELTSKNHFLKKIKTQIWICIDKQILIHSFLLLVSDSPLQLIWKWWCHLKATGHEKL